MARDRARSVIGIAGALAFVLGTAGSASAQVRRHTVTSAKETPTVAPAAAPPAVRSGPVVEAERHLLAYRTKEAREAIDGIKAKAATDADVAIVLARVLEQEKKYPEAVTQLEKASTLSAADPAAQVYLGETLLRQKKSSEATAAFKKAAELAEEKLEKDDKDADALYYLGVAQQRLRQYDKAVTTLEKARDLDKGNPLPTYQLGVTRAFQQRWTDAVAELTKAITANSGIAYAYYYRALAQDKLGKKDQLVLDMQRFLALAPTAPEAENAVAVVKAAQR